MTHYEFSLRIVSMTLLGHRRYIEPLIDLDHINVWKWDVQTDEQHIEDLVFWWRITHTM
jgi:hypothetical protein